MCETVLGSIANLADAFTPNPFPFDSQVKLDDPFVGAFEMVRHIEEDKRDVIIKQAFYIHRGREALARSQTTSKSEDFAVGRFVDQDPCMIADDELAYAFARRGELLRDQRN